ncbi:MFS transporter [Massilia cavernae]|uniref:MFS transporter n=1 Tax=Massilia cavernae TaxID=2320864 RepID=UPI0027D92692|nr:MFS transporter [Massilia cavernae]
MRNRRRMLALLAIPAFRNVCLACGVAGVAGYGYGVWTPSYLVRSHGMSLAHAGLVFGVVSGVGAIVGALLSGLLCDKLVRRDTRWQLGLPMLGVALSIPASLAFFLWPSGGHWMLGALKVPHPDRVRIHICAVRQLVAGAVVQRHQPHGAGAPAQHRGRHAEPVHDAARPRHRPDGDRLPERLVPAAVRPGGLALRTGQRDVPDGVSVVLYGLAMSPYRTRLASMAPAAHPFGKREIAE